MSAASVLETGYVLVLFGGYVGLWALKRARQRRATGRDPLVFAIATTPLQRYLAHLLNVMTGAAVLLIVAHASGLAFPGLERTAALESSVVDLVGLGLGVSGLGLCALAQWTMGASWRVGIDEVVGTPLVTAGLYRWIRNPTYLGLFAMNAGFWLIWPTAAVGLFVLAFFLILEVQVRCEEEHLERQHGDAFRAYRDRTWRYLPPLY